MADKTKIEWADATWNPLLGCRRVSAGCEHCYAERMAARFNRPGQWGEGLAKVVTRPDGAREARWTGETTAQTHKFAEPLHWRKPRRIFVCSTSDLFYEGHSDMAIERAFSVMAQCHQHQFLVLTKRPSRMRRFIADRLFHWPRANVWLGVSVEDQAAADERIPIMIDTPAAILFLSVEPMLGPVDISDYLPDLDWVICGGESGPGARPMPPDWARSLRDQCAAAGVPYFFKQWGEWLPGEFGSPPMVEFQDGSSMDKHALPSDFDRERDWDDGLSAVANGDEHAIFVRAGKRRAGHVLDGREHREWPR